MVIRTEVCKIPKPTPFNILCCLLQIRGTCFFYQKLSFSLHILKKCYRTKVEASFSVLNMISYQQNKNILKYIKWKAKQVRVDKQFQTLDMFVLPKWDQIKQRLLENCSFHEIMLLFHVSTFRSTIFLLITIHFTAKQMD